MATAEFAVALPAVVVVLTLVVALTQLLLTHHRTWNAAALAARSAARGDSDDAVRRAVVATGVPASVAVSRGGGWVSVSLVTRTPAPLGWALPDVDAHAVAAQESGDGPSDDHVVAPAAAAHASASAVPVAAQAPKRAP